MRDSFTPSLLDRLTDEQPQYKRETSQGWSMSMHRYREAVLRDLRWLFNSARQTESHPMYQYSEIPTSVLNYGMRDFTGLSAGTVSRDAIEREVAEAIRRYEPRILPETLSVVLVSTTEDLEQGRLVLELHGQLWASPLPEHLQVKTEFQLESGVVLLTEL